MCSLYQIPQLDKLMTLSNLSDKVAMRMMMMIIIIIKGKNTEDFPEMYVFQTKPKKHRIFDMVFLNDIHLILL
jgi:hypothetical protein